VVRFRCSPGVRQESVSGRLGRGADPCVSEVQALRGALERRGAKSFVFTPYEGIGTSRRGKGQLRG
jgi:hypothetical protein